MTEEEWLYSNDASNMVVELANYPICRNLRKARLYTLGFLRHYWDIIPACSKEFVEFFENNLDIIIEETKRKDLTEKALAEHRQALTEHEQDIWRLLHNFCSGPTSSEIIHARWSLYVDYIFVHTTYHMAQFEARLEQISVASFLLRDIFGNPFRPRTTKFSWLARTSWVTPLITAMCLDIYDHGRFEELPYLADALEDYGCRDEAILEHCRNSRFHAKGCWVVDLLLGGHCEQSGIVQL